MKSKCTKCQEMRKASGLIVALLWFICLWLHIYELNRFKA